MSHGPGLSGLDLVLAGRHLMVGWSVCLSLACESEPAAKVTLQVGPEQVIDFQPKSAFAHYYRLTGQDDILRIVLASYEVGCQKYRPPPEGEVFVTVTVRVPPSNKLEVGKIPWNGLSSVLEPADEEDAVPENTALPFVRLANEGRSLPAGGFLNLKTIDPVAFGLVQGTFAFRDAESGQPSNTALLGDFSVRICQLQLDAAPKKHVE